MIITVEIYKIVSDITKEKKKKKNPKILMLKLPKGQKN